MKKSLAQAIFGLDVPQHKKDAFEASALFLLERRDPMGALMVAMYFGFTGSERLTFKDCGKHIGVGANRARSIVVKSLHTLQHISIKRKLARAYWDENEFKN